MQGSGTAPRGEKSSKAANADDMRSGRTNAWPRAPGLFPRWGTSGDAFQDVFDVHRGRPPSADSDPLLQNVERTAAGAPACAAPPGARSRQRWPSTTWQCVSMGRDGHPSQSLGNRRQTSTYLLYHRRLTSRIPAISMMGMVTASERAAETGGSSGRVLRATLPLGTPLSNSRVVLSVPLRYYGDDLPPPTPPSA